MDKGFDGLIPKINEKGYNVSYDELANKPFHELMADMMKSLHSRDTRQQPVLLTSYENGQYINLCMEHQFNPTKETEEKIRIIDERRREEAEESHEKNKFGFVLAYGQELYYFVESISEKNFLSHERHPYTLVWKVKADYDLNDYWEIIFNKGVFSYRVLREGGHAGIEVLEENITKERVLELLATKDADES